MYALDHACIATPIGTVQLSALGEAIASVTIETGSTVSRGTSDALRRAAIQIEQWFAGERDNFDLALVPLASTRGTALRQGIMMIGFGDVMSYGALAQKIGSGPRAIGQACARNPVPIIVPCHRVVNAGGGIGAYSGGGGSVTKQWLLAHEQRHRRRPTDRLL
ncbi:MAG: methylated-DNA--[protein]-cysteine S-methyltransferase [Sphingomonas sp.]|nr:methylated-DNA--[protein]-cysteine S-methyltransferase [Sphingomonas sp.]